MSALAKFVAPLSAAAVIGGAILVAPVASAATITPPAPYSGTDPVVPYGTDPHSPYVLGYHVSDHDEANTTNGQIDVPF